MLYRDRSWGFQSDACISQACLPPSHLPPSRLPDWAWWHILDPNPLSGCFSVLHITSSGYLCQHLPPWSCIYTLGELEGELLQAPLLIPLAILGGDLDAQSLWHQLYFSCSAGFGLSLSSSLLNLLHRHVCMCELAASPCVHLCELAASPRVHLCSGAL